MTRVVPVPIEERLDELPVYVEGPKSLGWWGMIGFIGTEAMLFACMIAGLFYLRTTVGVATEQIHPPKLTLPLINTVLLLASSVTLWWGEKGIKKSDVGRLRAGCAATLLLGTIFVGVQVIEYIKKPPLTTDAYHSTFYAITGLHGSHVTMGMAMIAFILVQSYRGKFDGHRHLAVQNVALYWHFVDAVWLTIIATIYLWPHLW